MKYDYSKLRGRIVEKFGTTQNFADALDIAPESVSRKLSNKTIWKQPEIEKSCDVLEIDKKDIYLYFFTK